ncbi:uncharacterized protein Z520_00687 [Fonsecaea multimorphosa CBS 102226]|uniref:Uncharacterized protein n=1 Tax=Fonsecaea multimorphosa CBS 102226 TaxID=1442371 RepID=A0A0D2KKJ7_9EURO|nr:uncharacterized protein Z520_00687 [Fonsecaea multimorphosa CBS 102226]KIY03995.1 hypothetical protein Z520_00687 [Fonsecaea multimorphosa CBS 102226]
MPLSIQLIEAAFGAAILQKRKLEVSPSKQPNKPTVQSHLPHKRADEDTDQVAASAHPDVHPDAANTKFTGRHPLAEAATPPYSTWSPSPRHDLSLFAVLDAARRRHTIA